MPATLSKNDILRALDDLPEENILLEEVVERLILLQKVRSGLEQEGDGFSHQEVKQQFDKSPEQRSWR